MDGPPIKVILNLLTMFHLIVSPLVVVLDLLDITLSLFVALDLLDVTLNLLDDALDLLVTLDLVDLDLDPGNIDMMMMVLVGLDLQSVCQDEDEDGQSVSQDEDGRSPVKPLASTSMTALSPDHHEMIGSYQYLWDAEYVEMSYVHQQSPDDLTLLLQNAPACRNIGNLRDYTLPPHCW
ncbi:hypothetical protein BS47DRAFT_1398078 [Hydnum rufescens UP504]|uniref:Uncharacterized protein n=1 Tax=Hydnum rufescens UP504 TaxID=1448309 RepID=A0A9P6AM80_9AGAM|nr:hypothetical protein BS47DRAFT_1398078 [Hydnum rufescens UP504]